ncbi:RNA polymerase II, large subunit, CTD [Penicillium griseofulvum]|uniref:RNA polymerase II, large subunit, CTD n=1 Tax=Penicillium patulum TaxID=5078 RepID=A0A135LL32_PENPA|nr:RNA polymerase II, large subunit, CTD [Penicillium griseofulvum]KXG49610.1 RNA polymerase II, large subunit, CTD [Penicillium griseofulvum]
MAAQHSVVILKAAFAASLLRPDPTSVPHDEISHFHACLERALSHCSPVNLQICKAWLIRFVAFSSSRVKGLVNYLEALAASLHPQPTGSKVSPKRQRLHILYLLSDLLHHCKYHLDTTFTFTIVTGSLHLHIVNLVSYAATCDRAKNPRHHRRLDDLLDIWSKHDYFHPDLINKLREVVIMGGLPPSNDTANESNPAKKPGKDVPFILPSTHGDPSTPWYDLPAGNLLPHIIPNSTLPIQPESVKPIQLLAGPADKELVDAVKSYLGDVDKLFNPEAILYDPDTDMDEMGQTVIRGENTSDILDGRHYYGWSLDFCQTADSDTEGLRSPSPSRSRSFNMVSVITMTHKEEAVLHAALHVVRGVVTTDLVNRLLHTSRLPTNINISPHTPALSPPPIPRDLTIVIPKHQHPTMVLGHTRKCRQCPSLHPGPCPRLLSLPHTMLLKCSRNRITLLRCNRDRTMDSTMDTDTACPGVSTTSLALILRAEVDNADLILPRAGEDGTENVHMKRCMSNA